MALTPEQILAAHKANIEQLFGLTNKAFESVEKLIELNVKVSREALNDAAKHSQAVLSIKDAQELAALQSSIFQPLAEKVSNYSRQLYEIASESGQEINRLVEERTAEAQQAVNNLVESAAKNAPVGTEASVAVVRSAISAANNAFESVQKTVKQASDVAQANFNAVTESATNAAKSAASRRRS
ncbi:Phasin (PHA-granule associated protein) [Vandammella animalimorsus]|uniref:Phasin (PHA-granule associated protein) n=1 Tax=Vandammella animalimorsus TaxID=2029117 RepID=A0A2A2T9S0_9BURK|nr:phasin family protein [Vandammella animalimorsus]PAT30748.1 Phasin (PHA-granule associated protein) [Vandammella animalimorsus]PAT44128.1 Phasin (PHA-granule associated protein) [Vandammella animalimorsus]PAX18551.1 Phasin (PHA-granule associated protein) [Vandammella animalimorsus]PAX20713.1 Phasin (PHA-granule associated protein) [Vandammella animalimorsus]